MSENPAGPKEIQVKVVLLGDDSVGKTSLVAAYKDGSVPKGELPVILPNFAKTEEVGDTKVQMILWDSACTSDFDEIRRKSYAQTNVFIMCFALDTPVTLTNVQTKWMQEIENYKESALIVLVGTKMDQRQMTEELIGSIRAKINPKIYMDVSAISNINVNELFHLIAQGIVDPSSLPALPEVDLSKKESEAQSQCCLLL